MDVIPVPLTDQPNPINILRTRTFFISGSVLDNESLRNALDQLIRNHWRKLGARLVSSSGGKSLEYHLPHKFEKDHVLFNWSSETKDQSIRNVVDLSTVLSPGPNVAFLPSMDAIEKLLRPADWPYDRKVEPADAPLLYIHLTNFNDATAVAMNCPHTLADQFGVANIVKAWLGICEGKIPPPMVGYRERTSQRRDIYRKC
jgi:hypothetical protein